LLTSTLAVFLFYMKIKIVLFNKKGKLLEKFTGQWSYKLFVRKTCLFVFFTKKNIRLSVRKEIYFLLNLFVFSWDNEMYDIVSKLNLLGHVHRKTNSRDNEMHVIASNYYFVLVFSHQRF
jgi:hypothetical protein